MLGEMGFTSRIHVSHLYKAEGGKYRLKIWGDVDQPEAVKKSVVDYVGAALDWNLVA
jgi:hypothetical protein